MAKRLILNADDCNLTRGVTRGILWAHDRGIVTSTTIMMNLPLSDPTVGEIKKRKSLGLGIHLNVTFARPLSRPSKIPTLLKPDGTFRRPDDYQKKPPSEKEITREYEAQVKLFEARFEKKPDHLDTHHHLHDHPLFFRALASVARRRRLPVRRSSIFQRSLARETTGLKTTDYLFGNLSAAFLWEPVSFGGVVENLPEGTSEIACHPGFYDAELRRVSSLRQAREQELRLFANPQLRNKLAGLGIELISFSQI